MMRQHEADALEAALDRSNLRESAAIKLADALGKECAHLSRLIEINTDDEYFQPFSLQQFIEDLLTVTEHKALFGDPNNV